MEKLYFKGLQLALEDNCYIKVFCCSMHYPIVRVERVKDKEELELIAYAEHSNILSALTKASNTIVKEVPSIAEYDVMANRELIDFVIMQGYALRFNKLSNGQVFSSICTKGDEPLVIVSNVSDTLSEGYMQLNDALESQFNDYQDFYRFASSDEKSKKLVQYIK